MTSTTVSFPLTDLAKNSNSPRHLRKGYHIPAGTTLIPNHWSIHLDAKLYPDPETFNPARFIDSDGKLIGTAQSERGHHSYGFGRRICPGTPAFSFLLAFPSVLTVLR